MVDSAYSYLCRHVNMYIYVHIIRYQIVSTITSSLTSPLRDSNRIIKTTIVLYASVVQIYIHMYFYTNTVNTWLCKLCFENIKIINFKAKKSVYHKKCNALFQKEIQYLLYYFIHTTYCYTTLPTCKEELIWTKLNSL